MAADPLLIEDMVELMESLRALAASLRGYEDADIPPAMMTRLQATVVDVEAIVVEAEMIVDPPVAVMLMTKRKTKQAARECIAKGVDPDKVREALLEVAAKLPPEPAEEGRPAFAALVEGWIDEVLSEPLPHQGA